MGRVYLDFTYDLDSSPWWSTEEVVASYNSLATALEGAVQHLLPGCFRLSVAILEDNEAHRHSRSSKQCCHVYKKSNWKAAYKSALLKHSWGGTETWYILKLRGGRWAMPSFLITSQVIDLFLVWYKNISGGLQRRSQGPWVLQRKRFTAVMLPLKGWCSNTVAAIANASPLYATFYLPSVKPTPLLPFLSVLALFIWKLCPVWVTGPGCSAAALWHIPSQLTLWSGELETGRSSGDLDLVDRTITLVCAEILTGSGRGKVVCVGLPCPSSRLATMIIIKIMWNT